MRESIIKSLLQKLNRSLSIRDNGYKAVEIKLDKTITKVEAPVSFFFENIDTGVKQRIIKKVHTLNIKDENYQKEIVADTLDRLDIAIKLKGLQDEKNPIKRIIDRRNEDNKQSGSSSGGNKE